VCGEAANSFEVPWPFGPSISAVALLLEILDFCQTHRLILHCRWFYLHKMRKSPTKPKRDASAVEFFSCPKGPKWADRAELIDRWFCGLFWLFVVLFWWGRVSWP